MARNHLALIGGQREKERPCPRCLLSLAWHTHMTWRYQRLISKRTPLAKSKSELNRPLWKMPLQGVAKQSGGKQGQLVASSSSLISRRRPVLLGIQLPASLYPRLLRPQDSHMTPDTNLEHNTALGSADCLAVFPVHKKFESLDNHFAIVLCMAEWPPPRWTEDEALVSCHMSSSLAWNGKSKIYRSSVQK